MPSIRGRWRIVGQPLAARTATLLDAAVDGSNATDAAGREIARSMSGRDALHGRRKDRSSVPVEISLAKPLRLADPGSASRRIACERNRGAWAADA
ncbi:MAG: hypothetical protein C0502_02330 [Opitutus sp.]|nr:hypothetical protein [Opitutus sp.]